MTTSPVQLESGGQEFPAKLTMQVVVCSIIAAFGGLMFGYDIGISGGVTSMDGFLMKFFHGVYEKKHRVKENNYCKYDNEFLQLFTSSLYLAAIVASFLASHLSKRFGRKPVIQAASVFFLLGAGIDAGALNLAMLIIGRLLLGFGVGFGNQAVPLFISEIAPTKYRGGLNICFQLLVTIGILIANLINFGTSKLDYGWRISLGCAAIPAIILLVGSFIIVETPASLIERGKLEDGRRTLQKIRGVHDVDTEFDEILHAAELSKTVEKNSFKNLMKRSNRPQLICGTILQVFQQFTGINVIMFYAPVLFQTMGSGNDSSLISSIVMGSVNVVATLVAVYLVDKCGRRKLLLQAVVQMFITQTVIGAILMHFLTATSQLSSVEAGFVVALVCVFVAGFAWSWGPLGWLIPSEIFPLETRNAGFFCAVSMNMLCTFIIAQAFLSMLCRMRAGIFFFFSAWIVAMGLFAYHFIPETKGIPIDEMNDRVWKAHWFWKRFFEEEEDTQTAGARQQGRKPVGGDDAV